MHLTLLLCGKKGFFKFSAHLLLFVGCCSLSAIAVAMQQPQPAPVPQFTNYQTVGEGKYRYWFWDLYQARLATPSGTFADYQQSVPLLLELRYLRNISKKEFVAKLNISLKGAFETRYWLELLKETDFISEN